MVQKSRRIYAFVLTVAVVSAGAVALTQPGPVTAMFDSEQKRDRSRAPSFKVVELPATSGQSPLRVLLGAGDLERAFDRPEFRPAAAIVPTNTELNITAVQPGTQRVLISRIEKQPGMLRALETQIAAHRKGAAGKSAGEPGVLRIGLDAFVADLSSGDATASTGNVPRTACFIATEFPQGGAVDRRELHAQERLRKGIAACLTALDAAGARSVVLPQMGASSAEAQANDALFEGQRTLRECRLINSVAGIALGIHDFAARRRNLREIGIVQWDRELDAMFKVPADSRAVKIAQSAYRTYAAQIGDAFSRGLSGQKTTVNDVKGSCSAILEVQ